MSYEQASLLYLLASVLFILALKGLSHPETSRRGNMLGMLGMALAIATTLAMPGVQSYWLIGAGLLIGGSIGTVIALKIKMTALPPSTRWSAWPPPSSPSPPTTTRPPMASACAARCRAPA